MPQVLGHRKPEQSRVGRLLGVSHQRVNNGVKTPAAQLPPVPQAESGRGWSWMSVTPLSSRENRAYIVTLVGRAPRCILGWAVDFQVDEDVAQGTLDPVPLGAGTTATKSRSMRGCGSTPTFTGR